MVAFVWSGINDRYVGDHVTAGVNFPAFPMTSAGYHVRYKDGLLDHISMEAMQEYSRRFKWVMRNLIEHAPDFQTFEAEARVFCESGYETLVEDLFDTETVIRALEDEPPKAAIIEYI